MCRHCEAVEDVQSVTVGKSVVASFSCFERVQGEDGDYTRIIGAGDGDFWIETRNVRGSASDETDSAPISHCPWCGRRLAAPEIEDPAKSRTVVPPRDGMEATCRFATEGGAL